MGLFLCCGLYKYIFSDILLIQFVPTKFQNSKLGTVSCHKSKEMERRLFDMDDEDCDNEMSVCGSEYKALDWNGVGGGSKDISSISSPRDMVRLTPNYFQISNLVGYIVLDVSIRILLGHFLWSYSFIPALGCQPHGHHRWFQNSIDLLQPHHPGKDPCWLCWLVQPHT